jgi:hypothetical protein
MEIFLLAAITSFLVTSALTSLEQPENLRTGTVGRYIFAAALFGLLLTFVLTGPDSPEDWSRYTIMPAPLKFLAAISLGLGLFIGSVLEQQRRVWGQKSSGEPNPRVRAQTLVATLTVTVTLLYIVGSYGLLKPGDFAITVGLLVLAAIAGWLFAAAMRSGNQPRNMVTKSAFLYILGFVALAAVIALFVARTTDWMDYWKTQVSYRVTGREMLQVVLGGAFGWLVRRWGQLWQERADTTGYAWAAGVLLALPLFAAVSPQFAAVFSSITGLKTPWVEIQFPPSRTEHRAAFDVERDAAIIKPSILAGIKGVVGRDLEYAAVLTALSNEIPKYLKSDATTTPVALNAGKLVSEFKGLFGCLIVSDRELVDPHMVEDILRPSASALSLLLDYIPKEQLTRNIMEKRERRGDEKKLIQRKANVMKEIGKARREISMLVNDREGCPADSQDPKWPDDVYVTRQGDGPYIYLLVASFQFATRNLERAITTLEAGTKMGFGSHPSLDYVLALFMYYGDRDLEDVIIRASEARAAVVERAENIKRASAIDRKKETEFAALQKWYARSEMFVKNLLAYTAAQAGQRETMAALFAKENYERLHTGGGLQLEDDDRVTFTDTYGYVLMAFGARKSPVDMVSIQLAHRLLVEAQAATRRLAERDRRVAAVLVESHLRASEKLLSQAR